MESSGNMQHPAPGENIPLEPVRKLRFSRLCVAALSFLFAAAVLWSNMAASPTNDEFAHLPAGYIYLKKGDFSLYHKNPPLIKMISALPLLALDPDISFQWSARRSDDWTPWLVGKQFMEHNRENYDRIFFWGRIPVLLLAILLAGLVYRWTSRLYGTAAALLALFLLALSPDMIAHSGLATVDVGTALFICLTLYLFLGYLERPGMLRLLLTGLFFGLAQLSKFSSIFLLFIIPAAGLVFILKRKGETGEDFAIEAGGKRRAGLLPYTLSVLLIFIVGLVVLNAGYGFKGSFTPLGNYSFQSHSFLKLKKQLPGGLPVPFPYEYIAGFDDQKYDVELGEFPNFFMEKWSDKGWWYYLPVAFLIKTPIPMLLLMLATFIASLTGRLKLGRYELFLLTPVVIIGFFLVFFSNLNVGVRYMIPLYPFLFMLTGRLAAGGFIRGNAARAAFSFLLGWYALNSFMAAPHYLAFFNELIGGGKNGYKYVIDSNVDWGQDLKGLKKYMDREGINEIRLAYFGSVDPAVYGINWYLPKSYPEKGLFAVSVNYLQGLPYPIIYGRQMMGVRKGQFSWLKKYEPVENIGNSILIFRVDSL